jgi:hypothetical protein
MTEEETTTSDLASSTTTTSFETMVIKRIVTNRLFTI